MASDNNAVQDEPRLSRELTAQAALLDFHSDRAVAHASFLIASVFGLLTLLAVAQSLKYPFVVVSLIPFSAFSYLGFWTLQRFTDYASVADALQGNIERYRGEFKIEIKGERPMTFSEVREHFLLRDTRQIPLKRLISKVKASGVFILQNILYLFLITALGSIVYLDKELVTIICFVAAILLLTFLIVFFPLYVRRADS